jgi:hypothetical protein
MSWFSDLCSGGLCFSELYDLREEEERDKRLASLRDYNESIVEEVQKEIC